jgi:hypothetical protein
MIHSDTVADSYSINFKRHAAAAANSFFDRRGNPAQVHVPGDNLTETVNHAHKRFAPVFRSAAQGSQKRSMRRSLYALFYYIATHPAPPTNGM